MRASFSTVTNSVSLLAWYASLQQYEARGNRTCVSSQNPFATGPVPALAYASIQQPSFQADFFTSAACLCLRLRLSFSHVFLIFAVPRDVSSLSLDKEIHQQSQWHKSKEAPCKECCCRKRERERERERDLSFFFPPCPALQPSATS